MQSFNITGSVTTRNKRMLFLFFQAHTLKRKPGKKPQLQGQQRGAQSWAKVQSSCRGRGSRWSPGETQWRPGRRQGEVWYAIIVPPGLKLCSFSKQWSPQCRTRQHSCHQLLLSSPLGSKKPWFQFRQYKSETKMLFYFLDHSSFAHLVLLTLRTLGHWHQHSVDVSVEGRCLFRRAGLLSD